jgi:hypothetical protein
MSDLSLGQPDTRSGLFHKSLVFLSSGSCLAAAIGFGIAAVFSFPLATLVGLIQLGTARSPAQFSFGALLIFPVIALGLPLIVALVALQFSKAGRSAEGPSMPRLARNLGAWAVALAVGPGMLVGWMAVGDAKNAREYASRKLQDARAIQVTDAVGLCAPPVYGLDGGLPTVRLTARLPRADHYGWTLEATDHAGKKLLAFEHMDLAAGVQTVPVTVHFADNAPVAPQDIAWPVVVTLLGVRSFHPDRVTTSEWEDHRVADTLAVLGGPAAAE